nr:hypothetical protein [Streptomyces coelicoflavus]
MDTFVRSGAYATPLPTPFVVGRDLVGEVAATGPGAAVALASRTGARVVAAACAEDAGAVREQGAAGVLDHHAPDLAEVRGHLVFTPS